MPRETSLFLSQTEIFESLMNGSSVGKSRRPTGRLFVIHDDNICLGSLDVSILGSLFCILCIRANKVVYRRHRIQWGEESCVVEGNGLKCCVSK